jgi:hypothetical protein
MARYSRLQKKKISAKLTPLEKRLIKQHVGDIPDKPTDFERIAYSKTPKEYYNLISGTKGKIIKNIARAILNARHNKVVDIPRELKGYLGRHEYVLGNLIKPKKSVSSRKNILLLQRGSGKNQSKVGGAFPVIPILLSTIIPLIGNAISGAVSRKSK